MLRESRIILLSIMILLIMVACAKEEKSEVLPLLSDKQSQSESVSAELTNSGTETTENKSDKDSLPNVVTDSEITLKAVSPEVAQQTDNIESEVAVRTAGHAVTSQQKVVYTKLNTWNNNRDYYEIAFNLPIAEAINPAEFSKYIEFKPSLKGVFEKTGDKIVRFYPSDGFEGNKTYKVKIDQAVLLSGDYAKVQLSFYNTSPILNIGRVSLYPTGNNNEYYLEFVINHYQGRYHDNDYKRGISFKYGRNIGQIEQITYDNSGEMLLRTAPFVAEDNDILKILPNRKILSLNNDRQIYYSNTINEMRKFLLYGTSTVTDQQGKARIELSFSKNLDTDQSLAGLITVTNQEELAINISKFMDRVIISGNFELDKEYSIQIKAGIKALDNSVLKEGKTEVIHTFNRNRTLEFADNGVFLSSLNDNSINIKVVNYPEFNYQLWSVQVENIAEMMHNINIINYSKTNNSNSYYQQNRLNWYGEEVKWGSIKTEVLTDKDAFIELDLGEVVKSDPSKIYILNITGKSDDKLNLPRNRYYYNRNSNISKMLLFTDLAVTAKTFQDKALISVVDIRDASPVKRASVQLRSYNNTLLASGKTNRNGELTLADLAKPLNSGQFFVVAEKNETIGFLSSESMFLDNTKFNVERDFSQDEYKLELFLDRPEYRPGETVNLTMMIRDSENKLVTQDIPLIVNVYDPQNSLISKEKITDYQDGLAIYKFPTQSSTNTGNWRIEVEYATLRKYANFSIETFVPERINTKIESDKQAYGKDDKYLKLKLNNSYLFGAPLVGANCQINTLLNHNYSFANAKFSEYSFIDEFTDFDYSKFTQEQDLLSDEQGLVETDIKLLDLKVCSHPYIATINAKIIEEGGRPIERSLVLPVSPLDNYIGLSNNRYIQATNGTFRVATTVVDASGENIVEGTEVEFVVYGKRGSWWWDYNYNYNASYKKSESSTVIDQGVITIGKDDYISFTPPSSDFDLFIVEAKIKGNPDYEVNRNYFNSYWGDHSELTKDSSLELKADKDEYELGETVKLSIPSSKGSKLYLTITKKDKVVKQEIIEVEENGDYIYEFKTDASLAPNVFVAVRAIQGQEDINNDLPLRLFGLISVKITDKSTRLDVQLDIPEKIKSNSKLKGKIDIGVKKKTQYLVSIVDQGLINKSNYSIPNPWYLFYRSEGYYAQDYDNYSFFLNAQNQEIFRTIMIGGGSYEYMDMAALGAERVGMFKEMNRLQETGVQRFKPVSYFLGILETDANGKGEFEVDISDYIGALRVTVIAANDKAMGMKVKPVFVKDDIIAMPTLPRVLTPGDEIHIPVNIVIDSKISSAVEVELTSNDLVDITSVTKQIIPLGELSKLLIFSAKVKEDIGKAEFTFNIKSKEFNSEKKISVGVRLPSAYQTESKLLSFDGDQLSYSIPELGYSSSSQTTLSFTQGFEFDADKHLRHSIRYPYGGAVMKTATTFVQLLLSDFITDTNLRNELDANINAYFQDIVRFNKQGLWEWTGNWNYSDNRKILNAYALHTCILAKENGYNINEFVYSEILNYLKKTIKYDSQVNFEDAYSLFVLALADEANIAALNYFNEQESISVEINAKTMLDLAYIESGFDIKDITKDLKAEVLLLVNDEYHNYLEPREEVSNALELYYNSLYNNSDATQKSNNRATALALAKKMQSPSYWNYYDKGWNLFALVGYISTLPKDYQNYTTAELEISLAGKTEKIKVNDTYTINLTPYKNKEIKIKALSENAKSVMITANNVFVPKIGDTKTVTNNIDLSVIYTDLSGNSLDISSLEQGESFYAEIKTKPAFQNMEFATTYILPSGWEFSTEEVENNHYNRYDPSDKPNFVNVRDDRVIIYGKGHQKLPTTYKCKINTITKGKFMMPASQSEDIYNPQNQAVIKGRVIEVK